MNPEKAKHDAREKYLTELSHGATLSSLTKEQLHNTFEEMFKHPRLTGFMQLGDSFRSYLNVLHGYFIVEKDNTLEDVLDEVYERVNDPDDEEEYYVPIQHDRTEELEHVVVHVHYIERDGVVEDYETFTPMELSQIKEFFVILQPKGE